MPINIDGTQISGASIDGEEVQEITIDGTVVFTASEPPNIVINSVSVNGGQVKTSDTTLSATVQNTGGTEGLQPDEGFLVQADSDFHDENVLVRLGAGEQTQVSFSDVSHGSSSDAGAETVTITTSDDTQTASFTVDQEPEPTYDVTSVSASDGKVNNTSTAVSATVTNSGGTRNQTASFNLEVTGTHHPGGQEFTEQVSSLAPDESTTVTFNPLHHPEAHHTGPGGSPTADVSALSFAGSSSSSSYTVGEDPNNPPNVSISNVRAKVFDLSRGSDFVTIFVDLSNSGGIGNVDVDVSGGDFGPLDGTTVEVPSSGNNDVDVGEADTQNDGEQTVTASVNGTSGSDTYEGDSGSGFFVT